MVNGPMTKDTERALEAIMPIAKVLNIKIDADDSLLYCNGQAIGIGCNSTYATINEFLAYAMIWLSKHEYRFKEIPAGYASILKRYWLSKEQLSKLQMRNEKE